MRIPFDSLTLAAVTHELKSFVDSKLQRVSQLDDFTIVLGLYGGGGGEAYLLLSCDPVFSRVHFVTKRPPNLAQPPVFCSTLRARLDQARLRSVEQVDFDRILILTFEQPDAQYKLVVELMGKHSNLILVGEGEKIQTVAKPIGPTKSSRVVLTGKPYQKPPVASRPSLLKAVETDDLAACEGASPFLLKLLRAAGPGALETLQTTVKENRYHPVLSPANGAYPIPVAALGLPEFDRASVSIALEQHFSTAVLEYKSEQLKASMLAQLNRVLLSREVAIGDLEQAKVAAKRAGALQIQAELILAYGASLAAGSSLLEAEDYEGQPVAIRLNPELTYLENANKFFEKAKHAKARKGMVEDQWVRLSKEREDILKMITSVNEATRFIDLQELQEQARTRKWFHTQFHVGPKGKEEKPFEGHRIRELLGPGGATVLFGENATSNDYLTLRVAKPDDMWLHVRGSVSAHVVIRTDRHPEKVGRELLMFAAKVAVMNSPSKHAGYVPVDYTLKRFVRKPRGAPVGTALYTHEKTVHVEP
jgi:predicted ribosome quality control (RQC) complex YloA/Tae2 family protein